MRTFDLKSGAAKGTYPIPGGGICPEVWIVDQQLMGVDGISMLADGAVYVNTYFAGLLLRIPVRRTAARGRWCSWKTRSR